LIMAALLDVYPDGLKRSAIRRDVFGDNKTSDEITFALQLLQADGKARVEKIPTAKRSAETWFATKSHVTT